MTNAQLQQRMLRHGEILMVALDELPANIEQVFQGKTYIVGHSETGHHHIAVAERKDALTVYKPVGADSQDIYLRVSAPSRVEHKKTHDKHKTIDLPEGVYLVRPKTEYDPFAKLIQQVRD